MKQIKARTCKCCGNEFQHTGSPGGYQVTRCDFCRMSVTCTRWNPCKKCQQRPITWWLTGRCCADWI